MPSNHSSQSNKQNDQRPTLPPIRLIFGQELASAVPPHQTRQPSTSPHIPFRHLSLADDDPRYASRSASAMGVHGAPQLSSSRSHPGASGHAPSASTQPRGLPVPAQGQAYPYHPSAAQHPYQQAYPQQANMRGMDPRALGSGTYPYAPSQQQIPPSSASGNSRSAEGGAGSRYECSYCSKGFTRPSSLRIHLNTHTGEKPFMCPYEGCGRSFSVQSNMRRHAKVHTRSNASQQDQDDNEDDVDEE